MDEKSESTECEKIIAKLFKLSESSDSWEDCGVGFASTTSIDNSEEIFLIVKDKDSDSLLIKSDIQSNFYEIQEDNLIITWTENNRDHGLSFHEVSKCDQIWQEICKVQNKDLNTTETEDFEDEVNEDNQKSLPPCEASKLEEIIDLLQSNMKSRIDQEIIAKTIELENYIQKLAELFRTSEEKGDITSLHKLFTIFKTLFYLNNSNIYESMFRDDIIFHVIGAMEYDFSSTKPIKHREFLTTQTKLKQAIPIENEQLIQKIHQTFRVQYIKDHVLPTPSFLDEKFFSGMDSFILYNKIDIVNHLLEDSKYMVTLFCKIIDDETSDEDRRDMVHFIKELCSFVRERDLSHTRDELYKMLIKSQILDIIEVVMSKDDAMTKSLAARILAYIVEYDPLVVKHFLIKESETTEDSDLLINMMTEQMIMDSDHNSDDVMEIVCTLKRIMEPTSTGTIGQEFLKVYVTHCLHALLAPLLANTAADKPSKDDYQTAQLMSQILECFTYLVVHHYDYVKAAMISKFYLKRILILLKSSRGFLKLDSLRFLRKSIGNFDRNLNQHIIDYDLFKFIVDVYIENGDKDNLINSALLELFHFIHTENIDMLSTYFIEKYYVHFESITYVNIFKRLKEGYDNRQEFKMANLQPITFGEDIWFDQEDDFMITNSDSIQDLDIPLKSLFNGQVFKSTKKKSIDDDDDDDDDIFSKFKKSPTTSQPKKLAPLKFNFKMQGPSSDDTSPSKTENSTPDPLESMDISVASTPSPMLCNGSPSLIGQQVDVKAKRLVEYDDDDEDDSNDDPKPTPSPSKRRKMVD